MKQGNADAVMLPNSVPLSDLLLFASFSYISIPKSFELLSVSFILSPITLVGYTGTVEARIENGLKQENIGDKYVFTYTINCCLGPRNLFEQEAVS